MRFSHIKVGQIDRNLRGAMLAYRLPGIICYFIIIFVSIFDLGKKIYVCCKSKQVRNCLADLGRGNTLCLKKTVPLLFF